jgi:hypothetical protein
VLDAAYWVKGCSSLGRLRYALMLDVDGGVVEGDDLCLMDIKEGVQAAAPRYDDVAMPRDNAQRVLEGARNLSPYLGERMRAARLLDRGVVIRELLPQDMKLEIERLGKDDAMHVAQYLAAVVGKAHARQMEDATKRDWRMELGRNRSKTIDAPLWLWNSIVQLVSSHEAGYLEHCRRYYAVVAAAGRRAVFLPAAGWHSGTGQSDDTHRQRVRAGRTDQHFFELTHDQYRLHQMTRPPNRRTQARRVIYQPSQVDLATHFDHPIRRQAEVFGRLSGVSRQERE